MNIIYCFFIALLSMLTLNTALTYVPQSPWTTSNHLESVKNQYGQELTEKTLTACQAIWKLRSTGLGLSKSELFDIVLFIQTTLASHTQLGHYYIRKETTALARTIEVDPETKRIFIHLKSHGIAPIGRGKYKHVTTSIMYDDTKPKLVANCVIHDSTADKVQLAMKRESMAVKMLQGSWGAAKTYAVTTHVKKNGTVQALSFLQKLYQGGTLKRYIARHGPLEPLVQLHLMRDYLAALEAMHEKNLIHGDLHTGNLLVSYHKNSGRHIAPVYGVLIDFGRTMSCEESVLYAPKMQATIRRNPPEVYNRPKELIDAKAVDLYALAIGLYAMHFGKEPVWATKERFSRSKMQTALQNSKEMQQFAATLTDCIDADLKEKKAQAEILGDSCALLIIQMCNSAPEKRGSAYEIKSRIDTLIAQYNIR